MHPIVLNIAFIWIALLTGACIAQVIRASTLLNRLLALDTLSMILVGFLTLYAIRERSPYYMDAALLLSLISFAATLAAARYYGERKLFRE